VLTNSTVRKLHYKELQESLKQAGFDGRVLVMPDGEEFKSLESLGSGYDFLVKHKADRSSLLIALGGGVITDLGGMLAATYMRGIKLVHIPTTLLAQVDAGIGGKAAVNHTRAKNAIGCFYQPNLVMIDPTVLSTLNQREYLNGLAEVIKIALVADPSLFKFLKRNLRAIVERKVPYVTQTISQAVKKKLEITQKDPFERGLRKILNFGHTFGHALEAQKKFSRISHGEVVSLGMLVALQLSADLRIGNETTLTAVKELLEQGGLPTKIKKLDSKALWKIMYLDKKANSGRINFVLLKEIGKPIVKAGEYEQFRRACRVLS
jgi:3-dehydroquinate synthase